MLARQTVAQYQRQAAYQQQPVARAPDIAPTIEPGEAAELARRIQYGDTDEVAHAVQHLAQRMAARQPQIDPRANVRHHPADAANPGTEQQPSGDRRRDSRHLQRQDVVATGALKLGELRQRDTALGHRVRIWIHIARRAGWCGCVAALVTHSRNRVWIASAGRRPCRLRPIAAVCPRPPSAIRPAAKSWPAAEAARAVLTWLTEPPEGRFSGRAPERFTIPYALTDDECDRLVSLYQDLEAAEPTRFTGFCDRIQYLGLNGGWLRQGRPRWSNAGRRLRTTAATPLGLGPYDGRRARIPRSPTADCVSPNVMLDRACPARRRVNGTSTMSATKDPSLPALCGASC